MKFTLIVQSIKTVGEVIANRRIEGMRQRSTEGREGDTIYRKVVPAPALK